MTNGIEVTVSLDEFKHKDADEKLILIYKAVSSQQLHCKTVTKEYNIRIREVEALILSPKLNKVKVVGGIGALTGIGALIDRLVQYLAKQ